VGDRDVSRRTRRPALAALSALLLVLLPACSGPAGAGPALRVMTWNVRTADFDPPDWAGVVAERRPDVVAFQEICAGEAQRLADLLRDGYGQRYEVVTGSARVSHYRGCDPATGPVVFGRVVFGQAVLSRLPVHDPVTTVLPDGGGVDEPRTFLSVTVAAPGGPVRVLTTHLTVGPGAEEDEPTRARRTALQAEQVDAVAAAAGGDRVVVLGDLNMAPDDPRLAVVQRAGFVEVDRGRNAPTSNNNPDVPGSAADRKLDHVFVRGLSVLGEPQTSWVGGSDHRPLVAEIG
jgi:endonuclease/exonuclease/phosphatase family metal-dependent hydrolase